MATLETLPFDNTYSRLPEAFFARVAPTPLPAPRLVAANPDAAALIGLDPAELARPECAEFLSGARPLPGSEPIAALYAGHQFGTWVPQLGDGRALLLGEVAGPDGRRWDLHLKGAGITPFSRMGDGRAVLRSVIREYLCSEAMHGLGIPTSRALSIVVGDEPVRRERQEPGAMMVRLAPSHVRFGTFQVFAARNQTEHLKTLADYVIRHHYPELAGRPDAYPELLAAIARRTAALVAAWQSVGFVHGVLNSDNMSALGITIDYGPFAFIDHYRHGYVRNHTDHAGFYAYDRQPDIGRFNVYLLATAMLPLMAPEQAQAGLDAYLPAFEAAHLETFRAKLGLATEEAGDAALVTGLLDLMDRGEADFTAMFRALADCDGTEAVPASCAALLKEGSGAAAGAWFGAYNQRVAREGRDPAARRQAMERANPLYVLRTHLLQAAIDRAEAGDFAEIDRLHDLARDPFTARPGMEAYTAPPARDVAAPLLSCSS